MKAHLTTRCGCSREFQVTYPAPSDILIPLNVAFQGGWLSLRPPDPTDVSRARRFVLDEVRPRSPSDTAYYVEEQ